MKLDESRLSKMCNRCTQLIVVTSAVMVTCNLAGKEVADLADFKKTVKDHILLLVDDAAYVFSVRSENIAFRNQSIESMSMIAERCVAEVRIANERLPDAAATWTEERVDCLKQQIRDLNVTTNPVRKLIRKCV